MKCVPAAYDGREATGTRTGGRQYNTRQKVQRADRNATAFSQILGEEFRRAFITVGSLQKRRSSECRYAEEPVADGSRRGMRPRGDAPRRPRGALQPLRPSPRLQVNFGRLDWTWTTAPHGSPLPAPPVPQIFGAMNHDADEWVPRTGPFTFLASDATHFAASTYIHAYIRISSSASYENASFDSYSRPTLESIPTHNNNNVMAQNERKEAFLIRLVDFRGAYARYLLILLHMHA